LAGSPLQLLAFMVKNVDRLLYIFSDVARKRAKKYLRASSMCFLAVAVSGHGRGGHYTARVRGTTHHTRRTMDAARGRYFRYCCCFSVWEGVTCKQTATAKCTRA
ncbi:unnamed protein product, partial [Ectocarpus sp. 12 AP-2014]